jgi:hypothetical protein
MMNSGGHPGVDFSIPDIDGMRSSGLTPVDMHYHTDHSDAYATVSQALSRASEMGVGLSITDHNQVSGSLEACDQDDVMIIPGIELSMREGPHMLVYFYHSTDLRTFYDCEVRDRKGAAPHMAIDMGVEELFEILEGYSCVSVGAHPCGYMFLNRGLKKSVDLGLVDDKALDRIDGLEVINGSLGRNLNLRASQLALDRGKGITGETDGHRLSDMGRVVTISDEKEVEGFLTDLVRGRTRVVGVESNPTQKRSCGLMTLAKHLRYTWPGLKVHYDQNLLRIRRASSGRKR